MALPEAVQKHPVVSAVLAFGLFVFVTFPVWLAQVWPLFSARPFVEVMQEREWGGLLTGPVYGWISVALLLMCGGILFAIAGSTIHAEALRDVLNESREAPDGKLHQGLQLRFYEDFELNTLKLQVRNAGASDSFAVQVWHINPLISDEWRHKMLRWEGTTNERREILSGQTHNLLVLTAITVRGVTNENQNTLMLDTVSLHVTTGDMPLWPSPMRERVLGPLRINFTVTAASGLSQTYELLVFGVCRGGFTGTAMLREL